MRKLSFSFLLSPVFRGEQGRPTCRSPAPSATTQGSSLAYLILFHDAFLGWSHRPTSDSPPMLPPPIKGSPMPLHFGRNPTELQTEIERNLSTPSKIETWPLI